VPAKPVIKTGVGVFAGSFGFAAAAQTSPMQGQG
jgi:hypothetical protein